MNEKFTDTSWDRTSDLPIGNAAPQPLCYRGPNNDRMTINNEVESILQGIIVAYYEVPSVYFPGHGEGNDESYIDSRFPRQASNLSRPE